MNRRVLLFFVSMALWNAFISGIFYHPYLREKSPEKEFFIYSVGRMMVAFNYVAIIWHHMFAKTSLYYPSIGGLIIYALATTWYLIFLVEAVLRNQATSDFFPYFLCTTDAAFIGFTFAIIFKIHKNDYSFVNNAFVSCPSPSLS